MNKKSKIVNKQDRLYYFISYTVAILLTLVVLYPIIYIVSASFSDPDKLVSGEVWLFPVGFNLNSYKRLFEYKNIWIGYGNTILYTVVGTLINIIITLMCAYPLSRPNLRGRGIIMFLFTFTMLFDAGMIPNYILVKNLGLMGSRWAVILPKAMNVYNMIVCRTFIQSNIPNELWESAQIDGCGNTQFFFKMVLPLVKPIIAVLALWYGVSHWNSYFSAFMYLKDTNLYPLQLFLKELLVQSARLGDTDAAMQSSQGANLAIGIKYAVIVVSSAPLMCLYPFVQKHFQEGALLGSVKG